jgi:hypothetical protein
MTNKSFTTKQRAFGVLLAGLFVSSVVQAQERKLTGIPLGPLVVYPSLDVTEKHDDNVTQANVGKISSNITVITPAVKLEAKSDANYFGLTYKLEDARYSQSGADNYTDQFVGAYANFALGVRGDLKLNADYTEQHDARGSVAGQNANLPEEYKTNGLKGVFSWGAQGAQGKAELEAAYLDKEYTTNYSGFQQYANYENKDVGGTLYWRVMPKTQLLLQAKQSDINYKFDQIGTPTLDSTEKRYYFGVTWDATAQTSGTVKLGALKKDFDARPSYSTSSWDAGVTWSPLSYSHVQLNTSRQTNEVNAFAGIGDTVRSSNYSLTWTHDWNSALASNVRLGQLDEDYVLNGSTGGQRSDSTKSFGVGLNYQMRHWLKLGADYSHADRSSNIGTNDYKRDILMFTAGAAF